MAPPVFRQSACITALDGDTPIGQISWTVLPGGWYIEYLHVSHAATLVPLLARFRSLWKRSGRPILNFDTLPDNLPMLRLARVLGSVRTADSYEIPDLGSLKPKMKE